jgi:hypothetical protein
MAGQPTVGRLGTATHLGAPFRYAPRRNAPQLNATFLLFPVSRATSRCAAPLSTARRAAPQRKDHPWEAFAPSLPGFALLMKPGTPPNRKLRAHRPATQRKEHR